MIYLVFFICIFIFVFFPQKNKKILIIRFFFPLIIESNLSCKSLKVKVILHFMQNQTHCVFIYAQLLFSLPQIAAWQQESSYEA